MLDCGLSVSSVLNFLPLPLVQSAKFQSLLNWNCRDPEIQLEDGVSDCMFLPLWIIRITLIFVSLLGNQGVLWMFFCELSTGIHSTPGQGDKLFRDRCYSDFELHQHDGFAIHHRRNRIYWNSVCHGTNTSNRTVRDFIIGTLLVNYTLSKHISQDFESTVQQEINFLHCSRYF